MNGIEILLYNPIEEKPQDKRDQEYVEEDLALLKKEKLFFLWKSGRFGIHLKEP